MAVWFDPILPKLNTPSYEKLKAEPIRFGRHEAIMSPNQWEFTFAPEQFVFWVGGVRSGKTIGGVYRALKNTLWIPHNKGIVGRLTATDLELTTQRDFYEIADSTGLVKHKNDHKIEMYCCDYEGRTLQGKPTSEALFLHFDNPNHLKGHGIGWAWPDEGSEVHQNSFFRLVDRLSHPPAKGHYTAFVTSNPEGRNWLWKQAFDPETVMARTMEQRLMYRAIHNKTQDNPFLTEEYLRTLFAAAPAEWIRRYVDGEFDVFEGQIYKEFSHDIHYVNSKACRGWEKVNGHLQPPKSWPRFLGIDAGGADPWAFEFSAMDPWGNMVFYHEVYRAEVYVGSFKDDIQPRMKDLHFSKIPMDYENKAAQEELKRIGIRVTNAIKRNKLESINKMARYIHPNPQRGFPEWHPKAGTPGSPGIFFTEGCPHLVEELPQQRWRELRGQGGITLNEPDPRVANHGTDASLYVMRECREPEKLGKTPLELMQESEIDLRSKHYHRMVGLHKAELAERSTDGRGLLPPSRRERELVN